MNIKCNHGQALLRLRQVHERAPLPAHILFLRFGQWCKNTLKIIVDFVTGHVLRNNTAVINQRNNDPITNTIFKTIGVTNLFTKL